MPTYDYECSKCGETFEVFQSMSDEPLKKCILDGCNGKVKRLIGTGAGIIFKGSGFYETDYRSKSYHDGAKRDKEAGKSSSSSDKSGSDAKKKTETKAKKPASAASGD